MTFGLSGGKARSTTRAHMPLAVSPAPTAVFSTPCLDCMFVYFWYVVVFGVLEVRPVWVLDGESRNAAL